MSLFNNNSLFSNNITQHNQKILFGAEEAKNAKGEQKVLFGLPASNPGQSNSTNLFGAAISSSGNTEKNDNNNPKENTGNSNSLFGQINTNNKGSLFGNILNNNNKGNDTPLFGLNIDNQQSSLFGSSNTDNNNTPLFGNIKNDNIKSNLFGSSNNDNNNTPLFGSLNAENKNNTLFGTSNTDDNKGFLFGNSKTENNKGFLFGNSNTENNKGTLVDNSNTEKNKGFSISSSLNKKSNGTLFNAQNNENNNKDDKNLLGFSFGNSNDKNDNLNKNEESKNKISLFNLGNQNNIKIEQKDKIENNNDKIDVKIGIQGIKIETDNTKIDINFDAKKEELSETSKKKTNNYLFDFSTDLNKGLFNNNNNVENKAKIEEEKKKEEEEKKKEEEEKKKKEEEKKEKEKIEKTIEDKKEIIIDTQNKNEIKFGTPKKEKARLENLINFKQPQKVIDSNDNIISNSSRIDNHINNLTSSQRLEDNEQIQAALRNMYSYDILSSNSISENVIKEENKQYKIKKSRPINFKLSVQIEDISIMNGKELNMTSLSDETMSNLMKKVRLILKKKFKMIQEIEDFDIFLIKNGKKLPINVRELIGNYIKNQDVILVSLIHHSSDINEEKVENEEESEFIEQEQDEKKILCPKEKLPILKRKGYNMIPNECVISRMSIDEIKNVKNFAIYNENGKIEFDNIVSIFGVNFDKLFNIEHDLIEYEKGEWCHSPRGTNFNIPATITLYNIHSKIDISNNNEKNQYLEFLRNKCHKNLNGKFLSYNFETHELKYKIPYFY